ncbi:MAG: ATP-binding protein [Acidobacteriota bacterium]|nr:ATP-binding protein [Acidobacteriota bacterium]
MSRPTQRFRLGLRREILILLPVVLLLMVLLSTFTLLSYRNSVHILADERRAEAKLLAREIAESIAGGAVPVAAELRWRAPHAARIAVLGPSLQVLVETVSRTAGVSFELDASALEEPVVLEPDVSPAGRIVALAPFLRQSQRLLVQVELDSARLMGEQSRLWVLTWVVSVANGSLALLLMFFLRHLLAPWDQLLAHAQRVRPRDEYSEDETAFLVSSFERALEALAGRSESDEIAALEGILGPSLESGLLLIGREAEVLALNPAGAELLGLEAPEAPDVPLREFLAPHPQLFDLISSAAKSSEAAKRQEIEITAHGESRPLGLTLYPLKRDGAPPRGHLMLFADLTEIRQKAREERISVSLTQVSELAAGVAHEMRNGLATIRGYLALAERKPDEDSLREYLTDLRRESDHLQRVLEDFLTFARPGSTRMEALDLETLARRAAADPTLADLEVRVSSAPGVTSIQGDPQLLERAIRNLLHNAAEAERQVRSSGPLEVALERDGDDVILQIADHGAGIPEEIRERLFEPFVTGRPDGVGLGLSLAHRIVTLHSGRLRLEDRQGGGTLAVVELPVAASDLG